MAKVETRPLSDLQQDPGNARKRNRRAKKTIRGSLERFGAGRSIVIDGDDTIRAGNGTAEEAIAAGFAEVVVVTPEPGQLVAVKRPDWSDNEAAAYGVMDNRSTDLSEFDPVGLEAVATQIAPDFEPPDIGFEPGELERLIGSGGIGSRQDEPPPVPKNPVTKPGDVWALGDHRLTCGDTLEIGALQTCAAMFTDPPYGVSYVGKTSEAMTIGNDAAADVARISEGTVAFGLATVAPGGAWYVCAPSGPDSLKFGAALARAGVLRQRLVWVKDRFVLGRSDYHYRHEDVYYGWTPGAAHSFFGGRTRDSILECPRPSRSAEHPTMKPIQLIVMALECSTKPGDCVADPFCGSGSTLIACEQLGRRCRAIEMDPGFCDVIVQRWEAETGKKATR